MDYYILYDTISIKVDFELFDYFISSWKKICSVYTIDTLKCKIYYIVDRSGRQVKIGKFTI